MKTKTKKTIGRSAIAIVTFMLLVPPWKVEVGKTRVSRYDQYSPSNVVSGQYGLLFKPPQNAKGIDVGRLAVQFLLVGVLGSGIIFLDRIKK